MLLGVCYPLTIGISAIPVIPITPSLRVDGVTPDPLTIIGLMTIMTPMTAAPIVMMAPIVMILGVTGEGGLLMMIVTVVGV